MNGKLKQEIEQIPIPPELHQRSEMGVQQAVDELERKETAVYKIFRKMKAPSSKVLIATILGLTIVSTALFNSQVKAAIQQALQFVPGIGVFTQTEEQSERYVLPNQIKTQIEGGSITITGLMVDEEMTYITVQATNLSELRSLTVINDKGTTYTLPAAQLTFTKEKWAGSFWYNGKIDIQEQAQIQIDAYPTVSIPFKLVKAQTVNNYEELGKTVIVDNIQITAIATPSGEKARVSFVSKHPEAYKIDDFGLNFIGSEHSPISQVHVWDDTGKSYSINRSMGISSPASEFYFDLLQTDQKRYFVSIPEINVIYQDEVTVTLELPDTTKKEINHTFNLAGYPVSISNIERVNENGEEWAKVYVDVHSQDNVRATLRDFSIDGRTLNEKTGVIEYFLVKIDPNRKQLQFTITDPEVVISGPWTFEFPADLNK
ncbi:hypothetical protein ABEW34_24950 [Paenibacillus algorifonticola]|uniref:hypothetical protein n=1 Tax=Paenibacillus algorifonticola TaxID=684063 RepID=UPI003D2D6015